MNKVYSNEITYECKNARIHVNCPMCTNLDRDTVSTVRLGDIESIYRNHAERLIYKSTHKSHGADVGRDGAESKSNGSVGHGTGRKG